MNIEQAILNDIQREIEGHQKQREIIKKHKVPKEYKSTELKRIAKCIRVAKQKLAKYERKFSK